MNKISEKKVKELIKELKGLSSLKDSKRKLQYWYNNKQIIVNSNNISTDLIKEFLDEYNRVKKVQSKIESVDTDDRAITNVERDEEGNIIYYTFEIFRKNRTPFIGKLSCKEMETIYSLYSIYGANLTAKIVSREFPQYSFIDFKRILRAFNIYKYDIAPKHILENLSEEEIIERQNRIKENNVLRKLEKDQLSEANKLINKLASKVQVYENKLGIAKELLGYNLNTIVRDTVNTFIDDKALVILLSDCHVGAFNEPNGYLKLENYNETEIYRRFNILLNSFDYKMYDNIIVINLGDSVDSYNKETTRGGHELPTIISNKEQSKLYLKIMFDFFKNLKELSGDSNIKYYCIGESNHDGDWGWLNNVVLAERLRELDIPAYISDKPIDYINVDNISLIYLHGKNNIDQFKGFPLTLNKQTESWFNDFFVDCDFNLMKNKIVVKGDLHQFAITEGHNFQYVSAPSLYGSSQYIVSNFGKTNWGVAYLTISNNNVQIGKISD